MWGREVCDAVPDYSGSGISGRAQRAEEGVNEGLQNDTWGARRIGRHWGSWVACVGPGVVGFQWTDE